MFFKAVYMYTHFRQLEQMYTFSKKKILFCSVLAWKWWKKVVKGSRKLMQPITDVTYKENIQLYKQRLTYWRKPTAVNIMTVFVRTITFRKTLWSIKWKGAFLPWCPWRQAAQKIPLLECTWFKDGSITFIKIIL